MYNLLISIAVGAAGFILGWVVAGTVLAGILPAILGIGVTYFILARRTGQQLQALMEEAMAHFQALQNLPMPRSPAEAHRMQQLQKDKIAAAKATMEKGFAFSKWQFLIREQIEGQLGAIEYMQMDWVAARSRLEKAWGRNWQAMAMLSCIDHREKKHDAALERLDGLRFHGKKDPMYWGLFAWLALKSGDRERALKLANEGAGINESSEALKQMAAALANKKPVRVDGFAPGWYQFWPEHSPQYQDAQKAANKHGKAPNQRRGGYSFPQPRR